MQVNKKGVVGESVTTQKGKRERLEDVGCMKVNSDRDKGPACPTLGENESGDRTAGSDHHAFWGDDGEAEAGKIESDARRLSDRRATARTSAWRSL